MPSIKTSSTESSYNSNDQLPLGQRPEGDEKFNDALVTLENVFTKLLKRLEELEKSVKKLHETSKVLESTAALVDPFALLRSNQKKIKDPLVLTKDMEVKDGHK
tara:strand:+ start:70 stop:381 length:312 start_codon:yes stop_codon:yes gene_type:complete